MTDVVDKATRLAWCPVSEGKIPSPKWL